MQLFDDLEDFGEFDDVVSGDVRDPYTELARLRREEPVQRIDMSGMPGEEGKPVFMVYRYEEIQQMLRDNETFSSSIIIQVFGDVFGKHVMLGMDEPEHGRHRALVSKAFSQKALARWQDELVGRVGNELIDRFADRGSADLVKDVHLPVPDADHRRPARPAAGGLSAVPALVDLVAELHRQPGARPRGLPGAGGVLQADPGGPARGAPRRPDQQPRAGRDRRREARRRGDLLVPAAAAPAGVETTYRSLGNLLFGVAHQSRPARRRPLRPVADPAGDRGGGAVGAAAAHHHARGHPGHRTRRSADPAGCAVMPMLGAANRQDESVSRSRPLRHLPRGQGPNRMGARRPRLPRHAPGAARDARRAEPAVRPPAQPAAGAPAAAAPVIRGPALRAPPAAPAPPPRPPAPRGSSHQTPPKSGMSGPFPPARHEMECCVTDFEAVDFFTDDSLVPTRTRTSITCDRNVLSHRPHRLTCWPVTGYEEALAVYKDPAFSSCISVAGPFSWAALRARAVTTSPS